MKINLFILVLLGAIITTPLEAQIAREMKSIRNNEGVSVTLLTPSLYNLYKKDNLSANSEELLRKLKEINVLHIDKEHAKSSVINNTKDRLHLIVDNESAYTLVNSYNGIVGIEKLYAAFQSENVSSLVLWNENESMLSVIELKGNIAISDATKLPEILQIKGVEPLAYINTPNNQKIKNNPQLFDKLIQNFQQRGSLSDSTIYRRFFGGTENIFDNAMEDMDSFFNNFDNFFSGMGDKSDSVDGFLNRWGGIFDGTTGESISSGLEVYSENGKTSFKVNTSNSEICYLIDGKEFDADKIDGLTENIESIKMVSAPNNPKKSYIIINTYDKQGEFISYSDGVLRFRYNNQEYTFNIEKLNEPALMVNGRVTRDFNIDPGSIVQIRPASTLETELLRAPSIKVIIVTQHIF